MWKKKITPFNRKIGSRLVVASFYKRGVFVGPKNKNKKLKAEVH